jgi:hypothetical protein
MMQNRAIIILATKRFRLGLGNLLALSILGMTAPLSPALWAQQEGPEVVYAVAPEWPAFETTKVEQPHKEVVLVKVQMDGFGNVVDAKLLTPKSTYSNSAVYAAWLWKFGEPAGTGPDVTKLNGMTATPKFTFQVLPSSTSRYELGTAFIPPYEVSLSRWVKRKH